MIFRSAALAWAAISIALTSLAVAQVGSSGGIQGTVFDPSGTVVPGAAIEAKDLATGIVKKTSSAVDGAFIFVSLLPGTYDLSVSASGFQTALFSRVVVETGRTTDLAVNLKLGSVQQTVEVKDVATLLETTSNQVASTVRNDYVQNLPLSGRDTLGFALLTAGASQSSNTNTPSYTFDGLPTAALNISLDGINANDTRFRSGAFGFASKPPLRLDAIEELTVATAGNGADAAAGGAMTIRLTTRRGTSRYHGKFFEQFRNDALNANEFFNNLRGIRISKVRLNDFGGSLGGPLKIPFVPRLNNKLFFFVNYEDAPRPGTVNNSTTVLTPEAQSGIFRYVGSDGVQRTANILQLAAGSGYQGTLDPTVSSVLKTITGTFSNGTILPGTDLLHNTLTWRQNRSTRNYYPTARLDYQITDRLAWHGTWNLQHSHDGGPGPNYPGYGLNSGESKGTNYGASTGVDWTIKPTLFNSFKWGVQSSISINNLNNSVFQWAGQGNKRFSTPDIGALIPNATPLIRNQPAYTTSDELNWVKGKHTLKFGWSTIYARFFESDYYQFSGVLNYSLGVAAGDPVGSVFSSTSVPALRAQDNGTIAQLYATLTGRISGIQGFRNIDEKTRQYTPFAPLVYRESYASSGVYFQDSFRLTPHLTLNYGLRWEFTGVMTNTNNTFMSPTFESLLLPSKANFQPGVFADINAVSAIDQRSRTYSPDRINPAPNFGFAWNPSPKTGILSKLLGSNGKTVIRGSYSLSYFDEGLNVDYWVNTNAGNWQSVSAQPGFVGFAPGGLTLQSPDPPFTTAPSAFTPPFPETQFAFGGYNIGTTAGKIGEAGKLPVMRNPYVQNWTLGIQREVAKNTVLEVRYVGNKTTHKWHLYGVQETNIFENGFLKDFVNAQNNLNINLAAGVSSFQNRGLPGQVAIPVLEAAFAARGSQPALSTASGFGSSTFITNLRQGYAGSMANTLAGNTSPTFFCRLVGSNFSPCVAQGFNAPGPYPINFFRPNPYAADLTITDDNSFGTYNALQVDLSRSYRGGLTLKANYTLAHALADTYAVSDNLTNYYSSIRNRGLDKGPSPFDIRHSFQTHWTYELPFGRGRLLNVSNPVLDRIVGGWSVAGIYRVTSGRTSKLTSQARTVNINQGTDSGVILNGLSLSELESKLHTFSNGPSLNLYSADRSLIGADGRANPQLLALPSTPGVFGQYLYVHGPNFFSADMSLSKDIPIRERLKFSVQAEFLNFLNHPVFAPGSFNINSTSFGQTSQTLVGARNIQLRAYLTW